MRLIGNSLEDLVNFPRDLRQKCETAKSDIDLAIRRYKQMENDV